MAGKAKAPVNEVGQKKQAASLHKSAESRNKYLEFVL